MAVNVGIIFGAKLSKNNMANEAVSNIDVEQKAVDETQLRNTTVEHFMWQGVRVIVKDRATKEPKVILDGVDGLVTAGQQQQQKSSITSDHTI